MSRGPHSYRQRDMTRGIRAAEQAGRKVHDVVIRPDGSMVFKLDQVGADNEPAVPNEWDQPQQAKAT